MDSVLINLTQTEGTELPPETSGVGWKPLEASPSNAETGNSKGTLHHHHSPQGRPQRHPRCSSSSKCAHLRDVEMVTVASADGFDLGSSSRKPCHFSTISGKAFRTDIETSGAGTLTETPLTLESDHEEETARLIGGDSTEGTELPPETPGVLPKPSETSPINVEIGNSKDTLHHNSPQDRGGVVRENKALWYTGAILLVVGSLVNFASFGFAPQSLLASLGSVQFVSNVVFGKVILREIVTKRIVIGTVTIIVGNTLTLCFSPHQEDSFDTQQLRAFYDLEYSVLLLVELVVALGMHAVYRVFKTSKEQGAPRRYSGVFTPLAYAVCSASVGTQSVIQAKCLSELLKMTFEGKNQMTSLFTYVVIAVWFGTTIFWLMRMNRALAMFHGLFIIPALQVFWTLFSVIGGGVYFEEFKSLRRSQASAFALGVLVVFQGVYLLAPRTQTELGKRTSEAMRDVRREAEEQGADLRWIPRLEEATCSTSPRNGHAMPAHMHRCSQSSSLEVGDEDIDLEHTRMLSIGFFPSISTDQDVGRLKNALRVIEPGKVVQRLKSLKASRQQYKAISEYATEISPGSARCHDAMPPISPLTVTYADGTDMPSGDIETQDFGRGFASDKERRRVRGGDDAGWENLSTGLKSESSTQ